MYIIGMKSMLVGSEEVCRDENPFFFFKCHCVETSGMDEPET
jgi:hypothetical protein